jgi:hypothetical protein
MAGAGGGQYVLKGGVPRDAWCEHLDGGLLCAYFDDQKEIWGPNDRL